MPKRKTVPNSLRTFRLPTEMIEKLQGVAEERGVKLNHLVNNILDRFLNWDIFEERQGMVTISRETYRSLLDEVDTKRIPKVAAKVVNYPKEFALLKFGKLSPDTVLFSVRDYGHYSNLGTTKMTTEENEIVMTSHHSFGMKHSLLAKEILEKILQDTNGYKPEIMITENVIVFRLKRPKAVNRA